MVLIEYISNLLSNKYILAFIAVIIPILVSIRTYPVMILLVSKKRLMDTPVSRSMHSSRTATMGGIIVFIAFSITLIIAALLLGLPKLQLMNILAIIGGTLLLMFIGVKDDLIGISPKKKIGIQIFAACIIVLLTDLRITHGYNIFGLEELPYLVSVLITIFIFILVINAFNLIDGLDGLAGTIGTITSLSFGFFYFINDQTTMILVSFALVGSLLGFLRFNLSRKRKIFMGDSGSMFVGFLLAYQAIAFINQYPQTISDQNVNHAPIMAIAILSFPLLDTLRVFIIRIYQKRSPFSADRNHIHHRLLDMKFSHKRASLILGLLNIVVILFALLISDLYINLQFYLLILVVPLIYASPWLFTRKEGKIRLAVPQHIREIMAKAGF
ncbi:Undecaprenyl-phosphate alpha-N-acetylglucosaminyl 1-phosphate transferase [Arenibacter antarcticus]|uniref:MraY family glycosyltransferase n=1 Tax=Arenibacter antarcticus TaxID=2040469 RepID=A0ABW5VH64_9FLAO|nr:MraY family glycosyltransferase [Arenibacter sp. H213]MCM4167393.1 undecaprenyl/decaprenyl-phosphate alpha-N-acetylglucosaminyl 1-phosphate transferase [Arenibacter sp. H213]